MEDARIEGFGLGGSDIEVECLKRFISLVN